MSLVRPSVSDVGFSPLDEGEPLETYWCLGKRGPDCSRIPFPHGTQDEALACLRQHVADCRARGLRPDRVIVRSDGATAMTSGVSKGEPAIEAWVRLSAT